MTGRTGSRFGLQLRSETPAGSSESTAGGRRATGRLGVGNLRDRDASGKAVRSEVGHVVLHGCRVRCRLVLERCGVSFGDTLEVARERVERRLDIALRLLRGLAQLAAELGGVCLPAVGGRVTRRGDFEIRYEFASAGGG